MNQLNKLSIAELVDGLEKNHFCSQDIVRECLENIQEHDSKIGSFLSTMSDQALHWAAESDKRRRDGRCRSPWDGIAIAIKDNIAIEGQRLSCGSKMLENFMAPYNAFVVDRIFQAGLIPIGKTNMDEFAMGSSTENSAYQITHNPWNLDCVPGGSSGGSAAAVAGGLVPWSLGSDTGGSIRLPASFCGVVGLKPTYGVVSRYGLVAYGSSLDQIGPMAPHVLDCAALYNIIAAQDNRDSTSVFSHAVDLDAIGHADFGDIKNLRVGVAKEYLSDALDPQVAAIHRQVVERLEASGVQVQKLSLPHTEYAVAVYYLIATAEASSNLARYDGVHYGVRHPNAKSLMDVYTMSRESGFGKEVKRRILLGTFVLSSGYYDAYYGKASQVRTLIQQDFDNAFKQVDLLISPVSPTVAFKIGERVSDPLKMYLSDVLTISANLAGIPAISVNAGFDNDGMPIGMQIIGNHFSEQKILRLANFIEKTSPARDLPLTS